MKHSRKVAVTLFGATCLLFAGAATAEPVRLVLKKNGEWRARATYEQGSRMLCLKGLNNPPTAKMDVMVEDLAGRQIATAPAWGNEEQCKRLAPGVSGREAKMRIYHFNGPTQSQPTIEGPMNLRL